MTMIDVVIAGIGQTRVGESWDESLRSMASRAILSAIQDSGGLRPQALYAGNMLSAELSRQTHLGALLADHAGLTGIEAEMLECGGASGGAALRQGFLAVASGLVDVVVVVGIEKFTDVIGSKLEAALASGSDSDYESIHGLTPFGQAAMLTQRYFHENHVPSGSLAGFSVAAHANGVGNENAMFRSAITIKTYQNSETVVHPLNIYDIAPNGDGAAALILTRQELLPRKLPHPAVRVAASAIAADRFSLCERADPLIFKAVHDSFSQALQKANIDRSQVDLFEYYDVFSIYAALSLEAAGFAERGQGWKLAENNAITLAGSIPCATLGGLKARGNPGGATGIYQAVEATQQLRGQAGSNQVKDATHAAIQCLGGPASIAITHILEKVR